MIDSLELCKVNEELIERMVSFLKKQNLNITQTDFIINKTFSYFFLNSLIQVPDKKKHQYMEERIEELSEMLSLCVRKLHENYCKKCNDATIH